MAVATTTALIIGASAAAAAGAGASAYGAHEQAKAQKAGIRASETAEAYRTRITEELLAEGKPLRQAEQEAAIRMIGLSEQDFMREPGTGPEFTTGLRKGTKAIMQELAPYGLTESSVSGTAVGELSTGLLASDIGQIREGRLRLAGFAPDTLGPAAAFSGQAGQLASVTAGLQSQSPWSGFYNDIGQSLTQLGTMGLLYGGGGKGPRNPRQPRSLYDQPY